MNNQDLKLSGRTMSKAFYLADMIDSMYFKIEDVKKIRVKTVRSYFRRMRRKALSSSSFDQPSNYTDSNKEKGLNVDKIEVIDNF